VAKVVTSQGLTEFVQEGKFQTVANHKKGQAAEAPPLEAKKEAPMVDLSPPGENAAPKPAETTPKAAESEAKTETEHDEPLTEEEKTFPEKAQKEIKRAKRAVNKKHAEMMAAKDELKELERFGELQFNEKRELEKKLATLEGELQALKQQAKPPEPEFKKPEKTDAKYKTEQGEFDWEKFSEDLADYRAELKIREERKRQADERVSEQNKALLARHTASEEKAKTAHKDFDAVMERIKGTDLDKPPSFVLGFLNDSELSGELRYYLATHSDETKKIFDMTPIRGIKELGKIEDALIKPSTATKETPVASGAIPRGAPPPPIVPLNGEGASGIQTDPSKMDFKQLREYERARAAAKRERH
jgi:hypothetical protein